MMRQIELLCASGLKVARSPGYGVVALAFQPFAFFIWTVQHQNKPIVASWGLLALVIVNTALLSWRLATSGSIRHGNASEEGPPLLAELLLCIFVRTKDIDAFMGDLEELFERDCARMSRRRAVMRYWGRVARSLLPQMWQFLKRIGLLGLIVGYLRR